MRRMAMDIVMFICVIVGYFGAVIADKGNFAMRFRTFCGRQSGCRHQRNHHQGRHKAAKPEEEADTAHDGCLLQTGYRIIRFCPQKARAGRNVLLAPHS